MDEERSLENYLERLRHINEQMTEEGIRMDDALRLYRSGVELVREAEELLQSYEDEVASIESSSKDSQGR